MSLNQGLARE
jgi:hypothetical protein